MFYLTDNGHSVIHTLYSDRTLHSGDGRSPHVLIFTLLFEDIKTICSGLLHIYIIHVLCSQFQYTVTWVPNVCTAVHRNVYVHSVDMFVKTRAMSCYKFGSL